jgi:hypothetical protein
MTDETKAFLQAAAANRPARELAELLRAAEVVETDPVISGKFEYVHQKLRAWQRELDEEAEAQRKAWQAGRNLARAVEEMTALAQLETESPA